MATAKGIGGGFPMGACLASEKAAAGMVIGTHGSTFGGNPLAMAAGQAVFDIVANEEFLADVRQKGERLRSALEQMIPNHDHIFESVRGVGLMLGIKMKTDSRSFVNYLRTKGLLTVAAGDNVMRVLPPLNIEESHIREFVETLSAAAASMRCPPRRRKSCSALRDRSPNSPLPGREGLGWVPPRHSAAIPRIASAAPMGLSRTSLFHTRNTVQPWVRSHSSRRLSRSELSMLASINFNDELGPTAREIINEATDRQLS